MSNVCKTYVLTCKSDFDSFPFDPASLTLCTLQSAMPASGDLIADFNSAHAAEDENLTNSLKDGS